MRKFHYLEKEIDLDLYLVNRFDKILDRKWWGRFIRTDSHLGYVAFYVQLFGHRFFRFGVPCFERPGLSLEIATVLNLTRSPLSAIREFWINQPRQLAYEADMD